MHKVLKTRVFNMYLGDNILDNVDVNIKYNNKKFRLRHFIYNLNYNNYYNSNNLYYNIHKLKQENTGQILTSLWELLYEESK